MSIIQKKLISCQTADMIKSTIEKKIDQFNQSGELTSKLSASIGYKLTSQFDKDKTLDEHIRQADKMMYQIKKERKHGENAYYGQ